MKDCSMPNRPNERNTWLQTIFKEQLFSIKPLQGDASFRHYFRIKTKAASLILMDAPPEKEPIHAFVRVAAMLKNANIRSPEIIAKDEGLGFVLLEDLGDRLFFSALSANDFALEASESLYQSAIQTLLMLQACPMQELPSFDVPFILQELHVFREWFVKGYLKISLGPSEKTLMDDTFTRLAEDISKQPKVFIHRDYHSRNIMLPEAEEGSLRLALIDFQDAMQGPLTYDLVSLLKDCYVQWPTETIFHWLSSFYEQSALAQTFAKEDFVRAFDLCGLQRHLKVLGVFSRLHLRDNKPNYLKDLPLTLHYVLACLESYPEFQPFYDFMQKRIQLP